MLIDRNQSWSEACVEFQGNTSRLEVVIAVPADLFPSYLYGIM
jgi:hypothetical protein